MAQITYGTITITDTNDIESIVVEYARNQSTTQAPTSGWSTTRPTWAQNYYIWQRTRVHKAGTAESADEFGTAVCLTGSTGQPGAAGRSLTATETKYVNVASGTTQSQVEALAESAWSTDVPAYDASKPDYWGRIKNTYDKAPLTEYVYYKDNGTSQSLYNAAMANSIAQHANENANGAMSQASAAQQLATHVDRLLGGHFFHGVALSQATPASARVVEQIEENGTDVTEVPSKWHHNVTIGSNGIALRYNEAVMAQLAANQSSSNDTALRFYKPPTVSGNTTTQGALTMELSGSGLSFYDGSAINGGNIQAQFGSSGAIQSGDYAINAATDKFSTYGTKIDLVHGEIYSPYFRLSQGSVSGGPVAGIYMSGTFESTGAIIGHQKTSNSDTNAYWKIGYMTDTNQDKLTYQRANDIGFIELAPSSTFILQKNKIHTAWFGNNGYLTYPQLNSKYYDFGMNLPISLSDKFLYIRYNSGSNLSSIYQNDSGWTYPFYVDAEGKVHAQNFYIGDSATPIGGGAGTIAEKLMSGAGSATQPVYFRSDSGHVGEVAPTTYALNAAGAKGVDTSMPETATDDNVPTTKLMKTFVEGKGYITGYTETDPTVPSWAKASSKPSYALSEITSADDIKAIEALTGTSGFLKKTAANTWTLDTNTYLTSYTESDPTVPSWAKQSSKPSYGLTEISGTTDLQAIEALTGTNGFLKKTNSNTWTLDTNTYLTSYTETDPIFTASAAANITSSDITNWNGKTSNVGTVTSVKVQGSNGLTGSGTVTSSGTITISHADTSSQASSSNTGRTYIQSVTLDTYGHVTGLSTATETVTDTHHTAYLYNGSAASGTNATANKTVSSGNVYLNLVENGSVRSSHKLITANGLSITSTSDGDITFTSPDAFTAVTTVTVNNKNYLRFTKSGGGTADVSTENIAVVQAQGATKLVGIDTNATPLSVTGPVKFSDGVPVQMTVANGDSIPWGLITGAPSTYTPSSHTHGNITNDGKITATATIANGDKLVIVDTDSTAGSKITGSSITFGTSETTFLSNKGTWVTPVGTTYTFDGTYNASTNKAATVSTVTSAITNAINALDGGTIGTPSAGKTVTAISQTNGNISVTFGNISITKSQISDFPTELTPAAHTHGNIQNNGTLQTDDITIASGDKLVVTDSSNSDKIARASLIFTNSTTKFLREDGQFATPNYTTNTDSKVSSSNSANKLFLVGTTSQSSSGQAGYSNSAVYATDGALVATTYNGLTLTKATTGFTIAGGTTSKTLTVNESYTLGAACAKGLSDSSSASAISSTGTNVTTERDIYYGLPTINNSHAYTSSTTIYAPTAGGAANTQALVGNGTTTAPKWVNISPSISITAGTASATPKINVTVLGQSGTAQSLTTASTSVYGATKLSSTSSSSEQGLAATPKLVYDSINSAVGNYVAKSGDEMTGALTTPELIAQKIKADDVNVTHLLTAEGIQTKNWTAVNMATIDGSFYITPTISATTATFKYTSTGTIELTPVSPNVFKTNSLFIDGDATDWTQNSLIMITGAVEISGEYIPIGTIKGTLSGITTATGGASKLTLSSPTTNIGDAPSVLELVTRGTQYNCKDLKISIYSYYNNSQENLLGIMMTTAGTKNRTYIDIYDGTHETNGETDAQDSETTYTEPVVRIGNLKGLSNIIDGSTAEATQPTGWGIYTTNGFFKGRIVAEAGTIGNFTIADELYSGTEGIGQSNNVYVSAGTQSSVDIAGSLIEPYQLTDDEIVNPDKIYYTHSVVEGVDTYTVVETPTGNPREQEYYEEVETEREWAFTAGNSFGVTTNGQLFANDVKIAGEIAASSISIQHTNTDNTISVIDLDEELNIITSNISIDGANGTIRIGNPSEFNLLIEKDRLSFNEKDLAVAYLTNQQLYISQSVVLEQMDLGLKTSETNPITNEAGHGQWSWKVHQNKDGLNNLYLKWIG